jgi:hypothetical protein
LLTCGFAGCGDWKCVLISRVSAELRGAVCADGEVVVGRHGGADHVLLSPGSREIEHLGSAHSGAEVELLKAAARQRLAAGQGELDLGLAVGAPGGPLPITASRMGQLVDALAHGYRVLGFDSAAGGDEVLIENQTGWSIRKFVRTARRYRTIEIQAGEHTITAADPLPTDLRQVIETITGTS